ncbi:permease [Altererythrobacter sp. B11]|uniref:EamA family transporter n=1 Tax=Altererythrobacter sp. B11 TaxID=2060312 RepID=UPI000DC6EC0D|nr:EamA family transporter [Altererythrobacter sp. B11]BBC71035.1 permease [Altererythrobacter sp. B11]
MIASPIWLPAALLAGLFQAWRTALQQRLRKELTVSGAGLVRYAYGAPFAVAMAAAWLGVHEVSVPEVSPAYLALAAGAGLAQILGTALLILSFGYRGFVAGTAFSKTEALMAAVAAAAFFGERLSALAWVGIAAGVAGIMLLSLPPTGSGWRELANGVAQPAALCGLGAAALFALTGLLVKHATEHLDLADPIAAALVTLAIVMLLQTAMHGAWVTWREPATWRALAQTWRNSGLVGLLAALGSACWFTGFATAPVALVRVVGQVEVFFTLGFAHLYLAERVRTREAGGLLLIAAGVMLALLAA